MKLDLLRERKSDVISRFGPWTAHNIHLADDIYTIDKCIVGGEHQLRRVIQVISDLIAQPLHTLQVLDLGCLEGMYAIELARRGASVLGIEGREANLEKGVFVKDVLSLNNLRLVMDDVRNLSQEKYGSFDVVLCLGILYHLDIPDAFTFIERVSEVCKKLAIIDTHICRQGAESVTYKGRKYSGSRYREHDPNSPLGERISKAWASLDNPESFYMTRASLYNVLGHVGFTSVYECHYPREMHLYEVERVMLVAVKGRRETVASAPLLTGIPNEDWPDGFLREGVSSVRHRLGKLLPAPVKTVLKGLLSRK
jgi:SAM-dependent methyltransferase